MRHRPWPCVALVLVAVLGAGACKPIPTRPAYRSPVISSVTAFPTLVGHGDSVMVTVVASDPDGNSLLYNWEASGPLYMTGPYGRDRYSYYQPNRSQVFYCDSVFAWIDSCVVFCDVWDQHHGWTSGRVFITLRH